VNSADPGASRAPEITSPLADGLERPPGLVGKLLRIPTLESLHLREYRLLWLGQGGNSMGMWMDQIARGWLMYELTDSPAQLGLVTALRAAPLLLLSPVAGVLADRYDRKAQLIIATTVDGAAHAVMAVLIFSGLIEPWHVYATGAVTAVASVFQQPARQAMVATVVDRRQLTNAIGLDAMMFNVSRSTGPALAGALIAMVGTGAAYVAQAACYLLATLATMQLRPPSAARPSPAASAASPEASDGGAGRATPRADSPRRGHALMSGTLEGWRYVVSNETVRTGVLVMLLTSLLAAPFTTLLPVFARDILAAGPSGQGMLLSAMGIGALGSAIALATLGERLPRGMLMLGGAATYGLSVLAFGASGWFALSVALMVVVGVSAVACHALVRTVVQGYSPHEMGGRVLGILQQVSALYTIGGLVAGGLAAVWGAPWTVGVMAALCTLSAVTMFITIPNARSIR
jgi:MFS family permease